MLYSPAALHDAQAPVSKHRRVYYASLLKEAALRITVCPSVSRRP